jgi:hypothetical protein
MFVVGKHPRGDSGEHGGAGLYFEVRPSISADFSTKDPRTGIAHLLGLGQDQIGGVIQPLGPQEGGLIIGGGGGTGILFLPCLQTSISINTLQFGTITLPCLPFLRQLILELYNRGLFKILFAVSHFIFKRYIISALTLSRDMFTLSAGKRPRRGQQ